MALTIDPGRCPQSHRCPLIAICPVEGFSLPKIDPELCIECGQCMEHCGRQAVYKA